MGQSLTEPPALPHSAFAGVIPRSQGDTPISQRPLLWLNLVCLDAPLVAIGWQSLFARTSGVMLPATHAFALFLSAWFIYLGDRLVDSVSLSTSVPKSVRQQFCLDHRKSWLALTFAVGILDVWIICQGLDRATTMRGLIVGTIALCYLLVNCRFHKIWEGLPIKELIVGFVFATGTVVVGVPVTSIARSPFAFATASLLFAIVCALNCVSIATWERDLDLSQAKHSVATNFDEFTHYIGPLLAGVGLMSFSLVGLGGYNWSLAMCLAISSVLLLLLRFVRIWRDERTALADLVLLTPFVMIILEKTA